MELPKNIEVGGAWKKQTATGVNFISVKLNNGAIMSIFVNDKKTADKQPDYKLRMPYDEAEKMDLISEYDKKRLAGDDITKIPY